MNDALEAYGLYAVEEDVDDEHQDLEAFEEVGFFQEEDADYFFDDDEDDDDELLEALDTALDEFEAEQQVEAIKEAAAPLFDVSEIEAPSPEVAYRNRLDGFLANGRDLPRPVQARRRRTPIMDAGLNDMLHQGMERARASVDRRRAKVWVCSSGPSRRR